MSDVSCNFLLLKGLTKHTLCGIVLFKLNTFLVRFLCVPSIDSLCFFAYIGFIGNHVFLLNTDSTYSRVPGDKGGLILFRLGIFFWHSFYVQTDVLQFVSRVQFYAKLNVSNLYVTNLYLF
jgi:hypothetical protein